MRSLVHFIPTEIKLLMGMATNPLLDFFFFFFFTSWGGSRGKWGDNES